MSTVTRSVSNSARFGRVIQYRVTLDGVTFTAERMVGLNDDYTISTNVGHCGMSFHEPTDANGERFRVPGGSRVVRQFETLARELRQDPANFTNPRHAEQGSHHASLCTDKAACGRFVAVTA